jgi:hypothetical protein
MTYLSEQVFLYSQFSIFEFETVVIINIYSIEKKNLNKKTDKIIFISYPR